MGISKYPGVTSVAAKSGVMQIMVRFKHEGITYSVKNFTKLYGITSEREAFKKLQNIKNNLSSGISVFERMTIDEAYLNQDKTAWSKKTEILRDQFYENYIKDEIGSKRISKVTVMDIESIISTLSKYSNSYKYKIKEVLNPIFKTAMKHKVILDNPLEHIQFKKITVRKSVEDRVIMDNITVARSLYSAIENYESRNPNNTIEFRAYFYIVLMNARRRGEVLLLEKKDVYGDMIVAPAEITKTKVISKYPIPNEVIDYINSIQDGLLFPSIKYVSADSFFQRLITIANIDLIRGERLSLHDTRRLFLSILANKGFDIIVADICLDHQQKGVLRHYLNISYDRKKEMFKEYWTIIRK